MMLDKKLLDRFTTIPLEEMEKVRLMNRVDSKFIASVDKIEALLERAGKDFMIQEIGGETYMPYYTCYYDTPEADMYYQHVRGRKTRQKVRTRLYEGSMDIPFLEIKQKNNKGRTKKKRVSMDSGELLEIYEEFLQENSDYDSASLVPHIENHFYRITLVNKDLTERITIDTALEFHNFFTDKKVELPGLGIVEWKRDGVSGKSGLQRILRELHIRQSGFSKYCIGMALTNPEIKQNRLKEKLRMVAKINCSSSITIET